jgi:uncharacterized protein (UPF0210 family)
MNIQEIKTQIEALAKEENISFIKACQAMQSAASKMGDEKLISVIHSIKMKSPEMKALLN